MRDSLRFSQHALYRELLSPFKRNVYVIIPPFFVKCETILIFAFGMPRRVHTRMYALIAEQNTPGSFWSTEPEKSRVCKRTLAQRAGTRGMKGKEERERDRSDGRKWWKNVREVLVKLLRPWDCPVRCIRQGIAKSKREGEGGKERESEREIMCICVCVSVRGVRGR